VTFSDGHSNKTCVDQNQHRPIKSIKMDEVESRSTAHANSVGPLASQFQAIRVTYFFVPGFGHESSRESRTQKSTASKRSLDGQGGSGRALPKLLKSVEVVGLTLACGGVRWCKIV
jgi:hypothetical protein